MNAKDFKSEKLLAFVEASERVVDAFQWNENQWDFKRDFDAKSLKVFKRPFNDPNR